MAPTIGRNFDPEFLRSGCRKRLGDVTTQRAIRDARRYAGGLGLTEDINKSALLS